MMSKKTGARTARRALLVAMTAMAPLMSSAASASYRLGSGDVLQISVFGLPDYGRKVTVNVDGDISVPFLGEVRAAGMAIPELRESLAHGLEAKGSVRDPQVTVELMEHRPFYIGGDVAKPGAHSYRPGLTVRHAIALAGGLDVMRYRSGNPMLLAPDIQSEHSSAWLELVKAQARLIGLKAELEGTEAADFSILSSAPISRNLVASVTDLEERNLKERLEAHGNEIAYLKGAVAKAEDQAKKLDASAAQQIDVVKRQEDAIQRVSANVAKGVTAQLRADEELRALSTLKAQQADFQAKAAAAWKEVRDTQRSLERAGEERQLRLTKAIQDTSIEVDRFKAQVGASGEKLMVTGQLKSRLRDGANGPAFVVYRRTEEGTVDIQASADMELQPDDVLEVTIKADLLAVH